MQKLAVVNHPHLAALQQSARDQLARQVAAQQPSPPLQAKMGVTCCS